MNCFFHDEKPAVIACAKCGIGLCRDCMTNAAYTYDGKPLCLNCSRPIAADELKEAQKEKTWSLVKFIFSTFFLIIALIAFAGGAEVSQIWIIAGVAGIPSAFKATRRSREQRIIDEVNDRLEQDMLNLMLGWLIRLILKLALVVALAPIFAVISSISNLVKFLKSKNKIKEAEETLTYIDNCLNEENNSNISQEPQVQTSTIACTAEHEADSSQAQNNKVASHTTEHSHTKEPAAPTYIPPATSAPGNNDVKKQNNSLIIAIAAAAVLLIAIIAGYFLWYIPYANDRDALRTYIYADNLFLRSSKVAGVEYNILSKVPYGSELITYSMDSEWAEIKVNKVKGFVASSYLLEWNDFKLLNNIWGSTDAKDCVESSKCRMALLDFCKLKKLNTGNDAWQLYTLQKETKPNNIMFPRLKNGHDKFTEFAFILKNNVTQERIMAIYSFDEETEKPIYLYDEAAPSNGQIKQIKYNRNRYIVSYTNQPTAATENKEATYVKQVQETITETVTDTKRAETAIAVEEKETVNEVNPISYPEEDNIEKVKESREDGPVLSVAEKMPEFPGGMQALMKHLRDNIKYPESSRKSKHQGKVFVDFVVNTTGSIQDAKVLKSSGDENLDKEALRVVENMPKWIPAKQGGKPVRMKFTLPVTFRLK